MNRGGFNDPTHLPKPLKWPEPKDEDEAYDSGRQQQLDEEERRKQEEAA